MGRQRKGGLSCNGLDGREGRQSGWVTAMSSASPRFLYQRLRPVAAPGPLQPDWSVVELSTERQQTQRQTRQKAGCVCALESSRAHAMAVGCPSHLRLLQNGRE